MSTIISDYNNPAVGYESQPAQQRSSLFTCLACQVAFPTSERQRAHHRTDWHKYNLKRKVAGLSSVNAEQFAQKVLLQQAQGKEEQDKMGLIYECAVCNKSYLSENAFNNHIKSKKHLEMEQKAESQEEKETEKTENNNQFLSDDDEDEQMLEADHMTHATIDPSISCLFCQHPSTDFDSNLQHMQKSHGFFLPDIEYLADEKGLIAYLSEKINKDHLCLYCNGRGKQWQSSAAARAHMVDMGHCKMAYDESEDPEQLLKYYDFGSDLDEEMDTDVTNKKSDELVLDNGVKLGNRKFAKFYKQYKPKKETTTSEAEESQKQQVQQQPETLRRKERRQLLITDGKAEEMQKTADGIRESSIKPNFARQVSLKHNVNTLLRARTQNPI